MRKSVLSSHLLLLALGLLLVAMPRQGVCQRHIQRMNTVGAQYGRTEEGTYVSASYGRFLTNKTRLDVGGSRERGHGRVGIGEYSAYGASIGVSRLVFRLGEVFYCHAQLQALGRYERLQENNTGGREGGTAPQGFALGPVAGLSGDLYLFNRVSLTASATKGRLFLGPKVDTWPGFYGVGLSYHFQ